MTEPRPSVGEQVAHLAARVAASMARAIGVPADVDPLVPADHRGDPYPPTDYPTAPYPTAPYPTAPADRPAGGAAHRAEPKPPPSFLDPDQDPPPDPPAIGMAIDALYSAIGSLRAAVAVADPIPGQPTHPIDIGIMVAGLGKVFAELDKMITATQSHLAVAHQAAGRHGWQAPPAASAPAEVEAVIKDLLHAHQSIITAGDRLEHAGDRMRRLRAIDRS